MFGIGLPELIIILVLALLIFGPKKLPELGRTVGMWVTELRRATQDISEEVRENFEREIRDQKQPGAQEEPGRKQQDHDGS